MSRLALCLCLGWLPYAAGAQQQLTFEDFDAVGCWRGLELSNAHAHSGQTSARWADMDKTPGVTCADIPHDWTPYAHFTFWVYVEKPVDGRFMCIISSENPQTEGPDYWAVAVSLNRAGWTRYGIRIGSGGVRSPLGWDQVQTVTFTASGWDNTPNREAVVHIDELKLTNELAGPGPLTKDDEFFDMLRDDIGPLKPTKQAAAGGDYAGAKAEFLTYMRSRAKPVWRINPRDWDKKRDPNYDRARADRVCDHVFSSFGREVNLGPDIDWTTNGFDPAEPDYTPEWTYNLNRFGAWQTLGQAYWATGDEKYTREFVAEMLDWIHDQPMPILGSPNSGPCWRTIEQGIRCAGSWMDAYHYFLGSPSMTPEAHCAFVKSFTEHARTLMRMAVEHPEHGGNWVTMEMNGLAHVGVMFPEFKDAQQWRQVAYDRLLMELDRQVYPDGAQKELTTGYHQVARANFVGALRPAQMNEVPVPPEYLEKLERMYQYNLECMMPSGALPPLNDSGITDVRGSLREAYDIWKRPEYLWGATLGQEGHSVPFTSYAFPWAGQYVMRSGWDPDARYLMFEAGPYGTGHQHEDKLGLFLYAHGRVLLTEAGTYTYDRSKWRQYALTTASHNTIMVDDLPQNRGAVRATYEADRPLEGNWLTSDTFDWAVGVYDDGYGPRNDRSVTHERTVVFVRPDYFVVLDRLLGQGQHKCSSIFHLDADEASVDEETMTVRTEVPGKANLAVVPVARDGLSLRVVKGQEDPVQGWTPRENHRAVPTPIYEKTGLCPQVFVTLLVPYAADERPTITARLLDLGKPPSEAVGIEVQVGSDRDVLLYSYGEPMRLEAGGVVAEAKLALVRQGLGGGKTVGVMRGRVLGGG